MSNLPKQVQDQAAAAAEFDKQFETQAEEAQKTEPVEASQEPEATPPVAEKPKSDEDTWQKRYQTLQGMFNAEVPRLNQQVKELTNQLQTLQTARQEPPPSQQSKAEKLVTDKDVEAFGGELIDLMKRQAAEVLQQEQAKFQVAMAKLEAENAKLREQLGGVAEKQGANDRRSYYKDLAKEVSDYEQINMDSGFMSWLQEVDPLTGLARQVYLNSAFEQLDVTRTAALFNAYKQAAGITQQQPKPDPKQELQRQVAPGTSRAAAPTATSAEKIWSMREIEQFFTEASKGRYSRDEVTRIEAEIDAAVAAGRVR